MSIATQLLEGKISLGQAYAEVEAWEKQIIAGAPASVQTTVQNTTANVQTQLSNLIGYADTAVDQELTPAVTAIEASLDGLFAALTNGATTPANPLINAGLTGVANIIKALVDAAATKARAALTPS